MKEAIVLDQVQKIRAQQPQVGTRRLLQMLAPTLNQHGIKLGRDKLFDLLASQQLLIRRSRRRRPPTTDSNHPFRKYPSLVKELEIRYANQVWVSDITYLSLAGERFCYLSLVTDVYSRKIIGYSLSASLKKEGPIAALNMALQTRSSSVFFKTIHHSDRGMQYCCKEYIDLLCKNDVAVSMTQNGDPGENAIAERVNGILKCEFALNVRFASFKEAESAVNQSITTYNQLRLHSSCNYMTPDQAYKTASGKMSRRWKNRKKMAVNLKQDKEKDL